jgi:hypothetical protein
MTPYWRYAQELFPEFKKERIPVARFLCRLKQRTFSLLPIQLAPYCQYTLTAIFGALLLGLSSRQQGQQGSQGAVLALDPDSLVTPWLVACWLVLVLKGLKRAHAWLRRWYDLSAIRSVNRPGSAWEEVLDYFLCLGLNAPGPQLLEVLQRYSRTTGQFLFGIPSQQRLSR